MFELIIFVCINVCEPAPPPHELFETEELCHFWADERHIEVANAVFEVHGHHSHVPEWAFETKHICRKVIAA